MPTNDNRIYNVGIFIHVSTYNMHMALNIYEIHECCILE